MKKEILSLFPTPVGIYEIDIDCNEIYDKLLQFKANPHGLLDGSLSSYAEDQNILYNLTSLHKKIQICIDDYTKTTGLQSLIITGSWYNQMNLGCKVNLHRHEGSVVSGVFYVKAHNSVPLKFKSPLLPHKMNDLYDRMDCAFSSFGIHLQPKTGSLIVFPSWIEHETDNETGERCVISFNTLYKNLFFPHFT